MVKGKGLKFFYSAQEEGETPKPALDQLDISVKKGEFLAILGRNGSGKSTLAKHINALLLPSEGTILINGLDSLDEKNVWGIRQSAGMVFQNPDNQIIATLVEEDVAFGPENLGVEPSEIRERVSESLAAVNMSEYKKSAPHNLSGGQKQRVAIAGVLAMKPKCIVLDEPTAMLDPSGRKEVMDTVMRLNKEEGITIVFITHFMEEAAKADRVVVMDEGKIVMEGPPREVFQQPERLRSLGLDAPQATELVIALNKDLEGLGLPLLPPGILDMDEALEAIALRAKASESVESAPVSPSGDSAPALMKAENVTFIYNEGSAFEKKALDDVSLEIKKGEFAGLIGHTGSGKSTLIQHFNALMKPTSGRITLSGEDVNGDKSKLKSVRQRVGLVFQYPEHQLFEMTVFKDVAFGPQSLGLSQSEIKERVSKALAAVGLGEDVYEKSPFDLSGGQKRRAAIAGVLAMQPEILILDEPTAGLDPKGRDEILGQISRMREELNITVILVSHCMEEVAERVDRVIVANKGKIAFQGPPGEVFSHADELAEMGLAVPQPAYLMRRMRQRGFSVPEAVFTVEEAKAAILPLLAAGQGGSN
ncbi:MAG: energy-coupling factor transporter ATPase [Clostridiales bacterium]|jgi:energy-coupling factor transport system ATP-binding protein|nr:energy-coupling factor transporter ATPase [Clostridiales bacterium]